MLCNRTTKPKFTKMQIAECYKCKHASGKKIWCCLLGVQIIEQGKVLTPSKTKMAGSFAKAVGKHIASGMKNRSEAEIKKVMDICFACEYFVKEKQRCLKCGCKMNIKSRWATSHCAIEKW